MLSASPTALPSRPERSLKRISSGNVLLLASAPLRAWIEPQPGNPPQLLIHLEWPSLLSASYRIDYSEDLFTWQTIGINMSDALGPVTNSVSILDSTALLRPSRYYRIIPLPAAPP